MQYNTLSCHSSPFYRLARMLQNNHYPSYFPTSYNYPIFHTQLSKLKQQTANSSRRIHHPHPATQTNFIRQLQFVTKRNSLPPFTCHYKLHYMSCLDYTCESNCCNYYGYCPDEYPYNKGSRYTSCYTYYTPTQPFTYNVPFLIGVSVGSFVALAIIIAACCIYHRRRLAREAAENNVNAAPSIISAGNPQPQEPYYYDPAYGPVAYGQPVQDDMYAAQIGKYPVQNPSMVVNSGEGLRDGKCDM